MKKTITIGILGIGAVIGGSLFMMDNPSQDNGEAIYTPRTSQKSIQVDGAKGSAAYLNAIKANQVTGKVDPSDVIAARNALQARRTSNKTSALGLQWQEMGPNNIGGRTRTIFIDPDDPSIIFTGSVSGGLYKTTTGGSSWQLVDGAAVNNAVTGVTKTSNGDYYVSTGEGLHYFASGGGTGGILGGGVFKSTDGGNTFSQLSSTIPTANSRSAAWSSISFIEADPTIADRVYAGTNAGFQRTDDGGQTWSNPLTTSNIPLSEKNTGITDFTVATDGSVWVKTANQIIYSPNGDDGSFVQISGNGGLPANNNRSRIGVAPSNPDYIYVVHISSSGALDEVYRSTDRGNSWTLMIQGSASFNPFNNQGDFNLLLEVDPNDPERFLMGGVDLWSWSSTEGWRARATRSFGSPANPFYVHADNHDATWHPTNPDIIYVVNDGGIFRSPNNGFTWTQVNTNYRTLQLYSVIGTADGRFLGGTQDNGTVAILPDFNTGTSGIRTPGITYEVGSEVYAELDGDGGYVAASGLVPDIIFKEMQYGILGRSENLGESFESFYDFPRMDPQFVSGNITPAFAEFVAPYELWESATDIYSTDSIKWRVEQATEALGFASLNDTASRGVIEVPQESAEFIPNTFTVIHGPLTLTSDASGNLTGDGDGFFNPQTGEFVARFNQYFSLEVNAFCDVSYDAGDNVTLQSNTFNVPFSYDVPVNITSGDSINVQDVIQGAFYMGLRGRQGFGGNNYGGVWMTREVFDFSVPRTEWWHILDVGVGNSVTVMTTSDDGEYLWVGVNTGQLYRIGNLNQARSRETADVDDNNPNRVTTIDLVSNWGGRRITGITIDPNDNDRVMVTLGNYGNNTYMYMANNATSASPTFISKQGDLPSFPVYDAIFNYFNGSEAIIGTEFGVFSTADINAASPTWTSEDNGFMNVPVFMLKQGYDRRASWEGDTLYSGYIDLATHGRGYVRSTTLQQMNPISADDFDPIAEEVNAVEQLTVYPNPASLEATVEIESQSRGEATIEVRDINGRVVRLETPLMNQGINKHTVSLEGLSSGVYIVRAEAPGFNKTARLIIK